MSTIEFTRVKNDVNGNPRYVVHFMDLLNNLEMQNIREKARPFESITDMYQAALNKAKPLGGKKYTGKDFGGGIVFQSYNTGELEKQILELVNS